MSKAYRLFHLLKANQGKVVRYSRIVAELWGDDIDGGPMDTHNNIHVHLSQLRRRLAGQWKISTVPGEGLTMQPIGLPTDPWPPPA